MTIIHLALHNKPSDIKTQIGSITQERANEMIEGVEEKKREKV
jgi:hypothetical protein